VAAAALLVASGGVACATFSEAPPVVDASTDAATDPLPPGPDGGAVDAGGIDAPNGGPGCNGAVDCERVVFVTTRAFTGGDLGGIKGADAKCQSAADNSPLARVRGRLFRAWLSTNGTDARDHVVKGTKPYVRTDGARIAANFTDLTDGNIERFLDQDELDQGVDGAVWTATETTGVQVSDTCNDWTSIDPSSGSKSAKTGSADFSGGKWTNSTDTACASTARLYCFEE
jgi:hypothetical protein